MDWKCFWDCWQLEFCPSSSFKVGMCRMNIGRVWRYHTNWHSGELFGIFVLNSPFNSSITFHALTQLNPPVFPLCCYCRSRKRSNNFSLNKHSPDPQIRPSNMGVVKGNSQLHSSTDYCWHIQGIGSITTGWRSISGHCSTNLSSHSVCLCRLSVLEMDRSK